ncbi:ADP-ribosylhydrolase ARH1-like [Dreissena polymorpha]|uniref:ADP-ribosylhydrolase ARH1 n=1 Tax=Dreissena polymorpha TaxID=45954 RepID=A0A9D4R699_DREPO|nr:ADP-ribosylhydrolase ARH1-like [Dreissena polymorpha]KAH3856514.1 hypothetical protein DPMN_099104 [Dreissena polymorpha]
MELELEVDMKKRYEACMVLSGVGDALGFKRGEWEFCHSGEQIHDELKELGGLENIIVTPKGWPVSDDTVMHIATANALVINYKSDDELFASLAHEYKECMKDMSGRSPGPTCMNSCHMLKPNVPGGYRIPFDLRGGGCGAAMRAMCIGLRYPREDDIGDLIKVSVESGRMTHNHPTGYLGSFAAALFTAYSIQSKKIREWGKGMMDLLPKVQDYVKLVNIDVEKNLEAWGYFKTQWEKYLAERGITEGDSDPTFPAIYKIKERDEFYKSVSFAGWGGASGHDAPMIAYDALLSYDGRWEDLCSRSMFHGGDSDSTGVIAAACYGAMFGFQGVPENNYARLEKKEKLMKLAKKLFDIKQRKHNTEPRQDEDSVGNDSRHSSETGEANLQSKLKPEEPANDDEPLKGNESNTQAEFGKNECEKNIKKLKTSSQDTPGDENVNKKQEHQDTNINKSETENNGTAATEVTPRGKVNETGV